MIHSFQSFFKHFLKQKCPKTALVLPALSKNGVSKPQKRARRAPAKDFCFVSQKLAPEMRFAKSYKTHFLKRTPFAFCKKSIKPVFHLVCIANKNKRLFFISFAMQIDQKKIFQRFCKCKSNELRFYGVFAMQMLNKKSFSNNLQCKK